MRTLAIIPARGGSKRILRKNIKNFLGKPIINYSIDTAIRSDLFDEVMVSTDDVEIAKIAKDCGANVPFMRSEFTASDTATTVDVLLEVLENYRKKGVFFKYACCVYPTAPFLSKYRLLNAFSKLKNLQLDTVIPVTAFSYPIQRALYFDEEKLSMIQPDMVSVRSQDLSTAYHDCGQFYWFDVKKLMETKTLFSNNTGAIVIPELEVQDIDQESDWRMAEIKYRMLYHTYGKENNIQSRRA